MDAKKSEGEPSSRAACSAVDNSFTTVLWRRLCFDMRLHAGWTMETCERNFRRIVEQTLADSPPNAAADLRQKREWKWEWEWGE